MAKKKDIPDFLQLAAESAQRRIGSNRHYMLAEDKQHHYGVPIPNLVVQWLICNTVWPLQRLSLSGGTPKSGKSAFTFEMMNWYLAAGGSVHCIDTENKHSTDLMPSILHATPEELQSRVQVSTVTLLEEWQALVTDEVTLMSDYITKTGGKGLTAGRLIVVDSLTGPEAGETRTSIESTGSTSRTYSASALLLSSYMRYLGGALLGLPLTVHATNHEKKQMSTRGPAVGMRRPGGNAPDFQASLDIQFKKVSTIDWLASQGVQGNVVQLRMRNNSDGSSVGKTAVVPFLWQYTEDAAAPDGYRQVSWWDWGQATVLLLAGKKSQIKHIMDINIAGAEYNKIAWSKTLGITKEDACPAAKFSALIHSNPELLAGLQRALHIKQGRAFSPADITIPQRMDIKKKGGSS